MLESGHSQLSTSKDRLLSLLKLFSKLIVKISLKGDKNWQTFGRMFFFPLWVYCFLFIWSPYNFYVTVGGIRRLATINFLNVFQLKTVKTSHSFVEKWLLAKLLILVLIVFIDHWPLINLPHSTEQILQPEGASSPNRFYLWFLLFLGKNKTTLQLGVLLSYWGLFYKKTLGVEIEVDRCKLGGGLCKIDRQFKTSYLSYQALSQGRRIKCL